MKHIYICFFLIVLMTGCAPASEQSPIVKEIPVVENDKVSPDSIEISKKKKVVFPRIFDVVVSGFF